MNISVFANYKIKCKGEYSYNTPDYDSLNNWHTEKVKWQKTMSGGELMEFISKRLNKYNLIEVDFRDDYVYLDYFNPNTGECSHYCYYIEMIKENIK